MNRYKRIRLDAHLSQRKLAHHLGVAPTTVRRIEEGQEPSLDVRAMYKAMTPTKWKTLMQLRKESGFKTRKALAEHLGISPELLTRFEENEELADTDEGIMQLAWYKSLERKLNANRHTEAQRDS